jgi:outer membrane lipoprotein-sorting protein
MGLRTNYKHFIIFLLLILSANLLLADKVEDSYQQMLKAYGKLSSWQSVINQNNYYAQTKTNLKSSGNFYFQPGKIAIRYTKPGIQFLIVKNGYVTIYDKSSNTAMKSKLISSVQSLNPVEIVKTYWQKSEKKLLSVDGIVEFISIKPTSDPQIKEIKIRIDSTTNLITKLIYTDKQNNTVAIEFANLRINKVIPASIWDITIPKNATVLEQ